MACRKHPHDNVECRKHPHDTVDCKKVKTSDSYAFALMCPNSDSYAFALMCPKSASSLSNAAFLAAKLLTIPGCAIMPCLCAVVLIK